jgi:hypothetical protein
MRYCFEEDVDLRSRKFLRDLPENRLDRIDNLRLRSDFQRPLRQDMIVHSYLGNLVLEASGRFSRGKISFSPADVPHFVEGIVKVLDCPGVTDASITAKQTIQYYHLCLDEGILKR